MSSAAAVAERTYLHAVPDVRMLREVLRVSFDESGRERSQDEQHGDHVRGVEGSRGALALSELPPYRSTGSVSRYARKQKRSFVAIMADLESGAFGADGLLMWESSRVTRDAGEWIDLLRLMERTGKVLCIWNHGMRIYDPANHHDWHSMMRDAIDAERESRVTSERVRRAMAANAASGQPSGGRRAFGYSRDGRKLERAEAAIVDECARRVLAGESVRSIAKNLNDRGIPTAGGNRWHPGALRAMLAGTRIAGLRTHQGRVVAKGDWPAIVDETTHRRLVATLATKTAMPGRGRSPWVLTGFLRCGRCGEALVGNTDIGGTRRYICRKAPGYKGCGGLGIKAEPLEDLLGALVTVRLGDLEARRQAGTGPDDALELGELADLAEQRTQLADDKARKRISREQALEDGAALDRWQADIEARLAAKVRTQGPLDFLATEGGYGRPWKTLEVDERRLRLGALIEPVQRGGGGVVVAPTFKRGTTRFESERIDPERIAWRI